MDNGAATLNSKPPKFITKIASFFQNHGIQNSDLFTLSIGFYIKTTFRLAKPLTNCKTDQLIASQPASFDMFRPQCGDDGHYKPIQCYSNANFGKWCWCVDGKGQEIIGSKVDSDSNLNEEKCKALRKQNSTDEYWTAFYRHSTTTHLPTFGWPTLAPILMPVNSANRRKLFFIGIFLPRLFQQYHSMSNKEGKVVQKKTKNNTRKIWEVEY